MVCIFIDVKRVDSVSHHLLLIKLFHMEFRGNIYNFIKSCLSDQYQFVNIDEFSSEKI